MTREIIEDFRFIVIPYMVNRLKEINYEGQGGSDAKEFMSTFNELCDLAIKTLEQEPRWIPVSERLPEVGHRVIFSMKNDEIYIGTLHTSYNDLKITLEPTGIGYVYSLENVVAWMPLPQPYKAESEDKE